VTNRQGDELRPTSGLVPGDYLAARPARAGDFGTRPDASGRVLTATVTRAARTRSSRQRKRRSTPSSTAENAGIARSMARLARASRSGAVPTPVPLPNVEAKTADGRTPCSGRQSSANIVRGFAARRGRSPGPRRRLNGKTRLLKVLGGLHTPAWSCAGRFLALGTGSRCSAMRRIGAKSLNASPRAKRRGPSGWPKKALWLRRVRLTEAPHRVRRRS